MIRIAVTDTKFAKDLATSLGEMGAEVEIIAPSSNKLLPKLYERTTAAVISDGKFPNYPRSAVVDILNSLGLRIPVIIVAEAKGQAEPTKHLVHFSNHITTVNSDHKDALLSTIAISGGLGKIGTKDQCGGIPYYNSQMPTALLKDNGGLGILTIDATNFAKVGIEYGSEVYAKVKEVFQSVLFSMWGQQGCFRANDILCQKSFSSNIYFVFLNRSRGTGSLPLPGALEKMADRMNRLIENNLWAELSLPRNKRRLPDCIKHLPQVGIGYFGVMANPCLDVSDVIEQGIENSRKMAEGQLKRVRERQRELMHTLIQSDDLLQSHYQGVFNLQAVTKEIVDEVKQSGSIESLKDAVFGFEALIRVQVQAVKDTLIAHGEVGLDPKFLRPDVLFAMAKNTKVSLELDQACLRQASLNSQHLPGALLVNILPRNLYFINRLDHVFKGRQRMIFEVSESEAINNFDLILEARSHLINTNMGIAADDFGKGYASLERIIKIKPDIIKFDRSLIENIHQDQVRQAYVKGLVKAAKMLNTIVLAEGVELWEEAEVLKAMGINLIQGFLLHRPQSASEIRDQLQQPVDIHSVA